MSETTHTGCRLNNLLHNMSAPPRTKVNVRPLKGVCEQEGSSDQKSVVPLGFREVYRMNTTHFLNAHMPICCERRNGSISLCRVVALSHLAVGKVDTVTPTYFRSIRYRSDEAWIDEVTENAGLLNPFNYGLPSVAIAIDVCSMMMDRDWATSGNGPATYVTDPRTAATEETAAKGFAVLSRLSNDLFLAAHSPYSRIGIEPRQFALLVPDA